MAKKRINGVGAFSGTRPIVPASPPPSKPLHTNFGSSKSTGKSQAVSANKKHNSQAK